MLILLAAMVLQQKPAASPGVVVATAGWATTVALPQLIAITVATVALVSISYSLLLWRQLPPHQ